jgi:hypothetical protein
MKAKAKNTFTEHETSLLLLYVTHAIDLESDSELFDLMGKLDTDHRHFIQDVRNGR